MSGQFSDPTPTQVPADCLIVQVQFYNVAQRSAKRMSKSVILEKSSSGHAADVAKMERAAHQLAVVLALEIETEGWKIQGKPRRGPPIGPERQIGEGDSGEGSPL
jgi:hypothetical protein